MLTCAERHRLYTGKSEATKRDLELKELNNGRYAARGDIFHYAAQRCSETVTEPLHSVPPIMQFCRPAINDLSLSVF